MRMGKSHKLKMQDNIASVSLIILCHWSFLLAIFKHACNEISPLQLMHVHMYSGSQSHTMRRGRASCSLWYAPVANVCDYLLYLDENSVIPEFRHFWKVTSPDEELFTVLYFPSDAFPMTLLSKLFTGHNSTGMKVTWLRTLASTRP